MKKILTLLLTVCLFSACSSDDPSDESIITAGNVDFTPFDYWLQRNYTAPYNIEFKWRYDDKESNLNYTTVPADYESAVTLAHLVKYLCIESYDEVGGINFTRRYFPKLIFCIGEWEYNNNGTMILGTAEGGRKILLSGTNYIRQYARDAHLLNEFYIRTIHHEFTHILNQTIDFTADFQLITGTGYVADKWNEAPYNTGFLQRGFITSYAQHSDKEDFAEMLSVFLCSSEAQWDAWMRSAGNEGAHFIGAKLDIVADYMLAAFNIDIYRLRAAIQRRQTDVSEGRIDVLAINN